MPFEAHKNGGKVVMCNLQATVWDEDCQLVIHEKIEKIMTMLMAKLEMPIPDFTRTFRLKVSKKQATAAKGASAAAPRQQNDIQFTGVDQIGRVFTHFKGLNIKGLTPAAATFPQARGQSIQPFTVQATKQNDFTVQCTFFGHYDEPTLTLKVPQELLNQHGTLEFDMVYHVPSGQF